METEMALKGLHKKVEDYIAAQKLQKEAKILILGAGEGAFERRLLKGGYKNIVSVDLYSRFKLKDRVRFIKADLNENTFSERINATFDLIVCIEIIEHIYSIDNFLKNIKKLLKEDGRCIITTPNVHAFLSRVNCLLVGSPTFFIGMPEKGGHVMPVYHNILLHFLEENRLELVKKDYYGTMYTYFRSYEKKSFKSKLYLTVLFLLYYTLNPLMVLNRKGSGKMVGINVIRKKAYSKGRST